MRLPQPPSSCCWRTPPNHTLCPSSSSCIHACLNNLVCTFTCCWYVHEHTATSCPPPPAIHAGVPWSAKPGPQQLQQQHSRSHSSGQAQLSPYPAPTGYCSMAASSHHYSCRPSSSSSSSHSGADVLPPTLPLLGLGPCPPCLAQSYKTCGCRGAGFSLNRPVVGCAAIWQLQHS